MSFFLLCFCILTSCSTFEALQSPASEYRDYVDSHLQENIRYDSGRATVVLKAIEASQKLKDLQEKVSPGFGFDKKEELYQIIVGLNISHPGAFSKSDLKISLNDQSPIRVREISGSALLENLYYFSYPYQRVFLLEFPLELKTKSEKKLSVKTPRGEASVVVQSDGVQG